jgi:hypothetical protein
MTGYGEKPFYLFWVFITLNIGFCIIFYFGDLDFCKMESVRGWEKIVTYLYFNNTTMLTIGYGDIYPVSIAAKIFTLILQLLGFIISTSFVALLLRRIFRY